MTTKNESDIKPGDVVRLKSGGPEMTVGEINDDVAAVAWFGEGDKLRSVNIGIETLVKVDALFAFNVHAEHPFCTHGAGLWVWRNYSAIERGTWVAIDANGKLIPAAGVVTSRVIGRALTPSDPNTGLVEVEFNYREMGDPPGVRVGRAKIPAG